ncbi:MAG: hypothetical protein BGO39_28605 [Chloroflexi bacterium 54-19]|nr:MAG: hypothetical protein BGO39_28605 [Chloroflexi bacterium 54-19]
MAQGLYSDKFVLRDKPYQFVHNERFKIWYAWVCRHCGIVRLEYLRTEERWFCDVCLIRRRLGTGPLKSTKARKD